MRWDLEAARWVLRDLAPEVLPHLAVQALQEGIDAESLAILAGLHRPTAEEAGPLFEAMLRELGVAIPSHDTAVWTVATDVCSTITSGSLSPGKGAKRLATLARELDPMPEPLLEFIGLESELEDFGDATRIAYYGEEHCARVRHELEQAIIAAAARLRSDEAG